MQEKHEKKQNILYSLFFIHYFFVSLHVFLEQMTTLTDIRRPIEEDFRRFEERYNEFLKSDNPLLNEVLSYIATRRGKQLRPMLVLLSATLSKGVTSKTYDTAVALEMLHTASLIHDDVVDDSPMRRGTASVHAKWSNKVAVLVGDYILAKVIQTIAALRNTRIMTIIGEMSRSLTSGELLQLHTEAGMWIDEEQYFRIIEQKTACLFAACTEAGAESSGTTDRQASALREFGRCLGICFQLKDDVLDYSDADELGKPTMHDIRDGKATLPLIISLKRAPKDESEHIRQLASDLAQNAVYLDPVEAEEEIKAFVMRYEGVRYAYRQMQAYKEKALKNLNVFRDSDAKRSMMALLDYAINRLY